MRTIASALEPPRRGTGTVRIYMTLDRPHRALTFVRVCYSAWGSQVARISCIIDSVRVLAAFVSTWLRVVATGAIWLRWAWKVSGVC